MHKNWKAGTLLVGMQKGTATLENSFAVPQMLHIVTTQSSNCNPKFIPKRTENMCPHQNCTQIFFLFFFFVFLPFLGLLMRHMEVPRLGVQSEL